MTSIRIIKQHFRLFNARFFFLSQNKLLTIYHYTPNAILFFIFEWGVCLGKVDFLLKLFFIHSIRCFLRICIFWLDPTCCQLVSIRKTISLRVLCTSRTFLNLFPFRCCFFFFFLRASNSRFVFLR